jgi:hypothetical protein
MSRIETQPDIECKRVFPLNIHNLQLIHQAVSSYGPQDAHSEQIFARIGRPSFPREINT